MPKAVIQILEENKPKRSIEFDSYLSIGRNPENHLKLNHIYVSRYHAEIVHRDDGYHLRDLQSKWGTLVDGAPINDYQLQDNDQFVVGKSTCLFRLLDEDEEFPAEKTVPRISYDDAAGMTEVSTSQMLPGKEAQEGSQELDLLLQLKRLYRRYEVLHQANRLVSSEDPPAAVYNEILKQLFDVVPADRGAILVRKHGTSQLLLMAARARSPEIDLSTIRVSRGILRRVLENRVAILTHDAMGDSQLTRNQSVCTQLIRSAICSPLLLGQQEVLGFIYLDTLDTVKPFDQDMLQLVTAIAAPAAIAIKNAVYIEELRARQEELQRSYISTLNVITNAMEARDRYTVGHAWRVSKLGLVLADALGWPAEKKKTLEVGGVLHDVGKVGIRDNILDKTSRLSDEEFRIMRLHPDIGARILKDVQALRAAIPYVRNHHERWDGKGYPRGLKGTDIPEEGRLLAVTDAFDAMTSDRVYRKARSVRVAMGEIEAGSGTQFDPTMVKAFVQAYRSGMLDRVLENSARLESRYFLCPICFTYLGLKDALSPGDDLSCPVFQRDFQLTGTYNAVLADPPRNKKLEEGESK